MAMNIGEAIVTALISVGEPLVVNTKKVKDGRVEIVNVHRAGCPLVLGRLNGVPVGIGDIVGVVIGLAIGNTWLHAPTCHPNGKATRVMVAPIVCSGKLTLAIGSPSELASPDNEGFVKQSPLLEVLD
jgi:hypothetical protein